MSYENISFEKFTGYGAKTSRKISITRSYSFGIPPAFYQENGLDKFTYVSIFFNKDEGVIGLHFNNGEGFKISVYGEGNKKGASFLARSFFNAYGLDPAKCKGRYIPEKIQKDGVDLYAIKISEKKTAE